MTKTQKIDEQTIIRDVAVSHPQTIPVFEKYKIDYCCGGGLPLGAAAQKSGAALSRLLKDLEEAASRQPEKVGKTADWSSADIAELTEHIAATHHAYLKRELPKLERTLNTVVNAHGQGHGDTLLPLRKVFTNVRSTVEEHLAKEESTLFPAIREGKSASGPQGHRTVVDEIAFEEFLALLSGEHDELGGALARMREITADYAVPRDACPTYISLYRGLEELERDTHRHVHLENNILFPRAVGAERGDG